MNPGLLVALLLALLLTGGAHADTAAEPRLRRPEAARCPGRDMRDSFLMYIEERDGPRPKRRGTALRLGQARDERWLLDVAVQNEQRDLDPQRASTKRGKI